MAGTVAEITAEIIKLEKERAALTREPIRLSVLQIMYPKTRKNKGVTGVIPIDEYYRLEDDIAALCITEQLQRFYRGPRWKDTATRTRKADATGVVLYRKL